MDLCPLTKTTLPCRLGAGAACHAIHALMRADDYATALAEYSLATPYVTLLRFQRFAAAGCPLFAGAAGLEFARAIADRRKQLGPEVHTHASKQIGWR